MMMASVALTMSHFRAFLAIVTFLYVYSLFYSLSTQGRLISEVNVSVGVLLPYKEALLIRNSAAFGDEKAIIWEQSADIW